MAFVPRSLYGFISKLLLPSWQKQLIQNHIYAVKCCPQKSKRTVGLFFKHSGRKMLFKMSMLNHKHFFPNQHMKIIVRTLTKILIKIQHTTPKPQRFGNGFLMYAQLKTVQRQYIVLPQQFKKQHWFLEIYMLFLHLITAACLNKLWQG